MLELMQTWLDGLARAFLVCANVLLALMFLLINAEVVVRSVFGGSTLISDEYSGYLFAWLTLMGFLHGARNNQFINVAFAVNRLRGRAGELAGAFAAAIALIVCVITGYACYELTITNFRFHALSAQFSQTPQYIPQLILPIAFGLLSVTFAEQLLRRMRNALAPSRHTEA